MCVYGRQGRLQSARLSERLFLSFGTAQAATERGAISAASSSSPHCSGGNCAGCYSEFACSMQTDHSSELASAHTADCGVEASAEQPGRWARVSATSQPLCSRAKSLRDRSTQGYACASSLAKHAGVYTTPPPVRSDRYPVHSFVARVKRRCQVSICGCDRGGQPVF